MGVAGSSLSMDIIDHVRPSLSGLRWRSLLSLSNLLPAFLINRSFYEFYERGPPGLAICSLGDRISLLIGEVGKILQIVRLNKRAAVGDDLKEVLDYLKLLPNEGVFCIPFLPSDGAAFWTRKKVFWGGHSYGFRTLLKPYFPIMREQIRETLKKKPLNYLLFWRGYLKSLKDIGLEEGKDIRYLFGKGEYELYEVVK